MENLLIWVDEDDTVIGYGEKLDTHVKGQLHRAFSIFIHDPETDRILLQRRAMGKYHSGGKWSNACCSHPRRHELMKYALIDRLEEEQGLYVGYPDIGLPKDSSQIHFCGMFKYFAQFDGLAEHEYDRVYVYEIPKELIEKIKPNPEEIMDLKWLTLSEIEEWYDREPEAFSAWFMQALQFAKRQLVKY